MGAFPSFEVYVAEHYGGWTEGGVCGGCKREAPRLTAGRQVEYSTGEQFRIGAGDCEWCLRYSYGYDEAEARIIGEIVACSDVDPKLLQVGIDRAMADRRAEGDEGALVARITHADVMQERRAIAAEIPGARVGERGVRVSRRSLRRFSRRQRRGT